jgi:hypothetical protein
MSDRPSHRTLLAPADHFDASKFDANGNPIQEGVRNARRPQTCAVSEERAEIYALQVQERAAQLRIVEILNAAGVAPVRHTRWRLLDQVWKEQGA